tara:strand:+ start:76 stop:294 length:219 start_codon:yes stop_codon:yes gene_type:complete
MENHRNFKVVLKKGQVTDVVTVYATTKYHAMDLAYYKYPDYEYYHLNNLVRSRLVDETDRKLRNLQKIISKW